MDVEALIKSGKDLCLEGNELRQWVDTRIQEEREAKKEEREERLRKTEMEREEKLREIEREDRMQEIEREERRLKREQEREALQMQMELERMRREIPASQSSDGTINDRAPPVKAPRLPCFDDSKDLLDNYLLRFERYSVMNRWPRSDWASHLSALLSGKALQVYSRMDESEAMVYDKVKEALLRRYNLTEDGFCARFRSSRPERGERMGQFRTRIAGYLEKWIELSGKDRASAVDVIDLVMKEQLYSVCGKDLLIFLKERKPATADEVIELAENYVEAHGPAEAFSRNSSQNKEESKPETGPPPIKANHDMADRRIICLRCSKPGHVARNCTFKPRTQVATLRVESELRCTFCLRRGHRIEECWQKKKMDCENGPPTTITTCNRHNHRSYPTSQTTYNNNHSMPTTAASHCNQTHDSDETAFKCGCVLPVVSASCAVELQKISTMPVASGLLNGQQVSVLRDSGCNGVIVRKRLLPEAKARGKEAVVRLIDGSMFISSMTTVELDCPYFTGKVTAVEMDTPLYDVIIGNVAGVKCPGLKTSCSHDDDNGKEKCAITCEMKKNIKMSANDHGICWKGVSGDSVLKPKREDHHRWRNINRKIGGERRRFYNYKGDNFPSVKNNNGIEGRNDCKINHKFVFNRCQDKTKCFTKRNRDMEGNWRDPRLCVGSDHGCDHMF